MIKPKLFTLLLPAFLVIGGCNATKTDAAPDAPASTEVSNEANMPGSVPAETKSAYTVVDPASQGLPPAAVAALEKVKVAPPPPSLKVPEKVKVLFETSKGDIKVQLRGDQAPLQVKSFVYLAKKGFFDGTLFHRYADLMEGAPSGEKGRIIQGGDPLTKDPEMKRFYGVGGPGYQIPRERNDLTHEAFVIAAARSQDPDSAGSQFYFTVDAVPFLDQGDGYTVFGKVLSGKDVVKKLRAGDKINKIEVLTKAKTDTKNQ